LKLQASSIWARQSCSLGSLDIWKRLNLYRRLRTLLFNSLVLICVLAHRQDDHHGVQDTYDDHHTWSARTQDDHHIWSASTQDDHHGVLYPLYCLPMLEMQKRFLQFFYSIFVFVENYQRKFLSQFSLVKKLWNIFCWQLILFLFFLVNVPSSIFTWGEVMNGVCEYIDVY